uniref:PsbP C-terminal domain-containing protein n=1 Tax=Oryza glumipatula TaxID=40148 RepID=A0A0D9ZKZ9_9ORYZ
MTNRLLPTCASVYVSHTAITRGGAAAAGGDEHRTATNKPMPLVVGCPRRGPPPRLAGRAQRPPPPHSVAPKRASSSSSSTTPPLLTTRRAASAASLLLAALPPFPASSPQLPVASAKEDDEAEAREGEGELELERYTDRDEGFTLLKPVSWPKVEKAGATALFQQEGKGSNNIGIVVNPVRLSTLTEFGTPQFVAERLIQAEKKKESTKSAEVISAGERSGHDDLTVYEIEYLLDSTRGGMKRILSAAFVASRKLYLLNIAHSDSQEKPLDSQTRYVLEQIQDNMDVAAHIRKLFRLKVHISIDEHPKYSAFQRVLSCLLPEESDTLSFPS